VVNMSATEIEYQPSDAKNSKKSGLTAAREYVYNPRDKTFFGRTGSSWGKIGVFYLVYYSCLAAFFAICLMIFFQTMETTRPKQTGMDSLIKGNPGMAFRPMPKVSSTLIKFKQGEPDTYRKYVDNIKILLHKYKKEYEEFGEDAYQDCDAGTRDEDSDLPCKVNLDNLQAECNEGNQFGYDDGEPCVLMKLNKVFGWEPEMYTIGNDSNIPDELAENYAGYNQEGVAVTCIGENYGDVDNLGDVKFTPEVGFSKVYFPFTGQRGYQAPLVFLKMENIKPGVIVQVYCKAWAKNIYHHKNDKAGSMRFEVMVLN